MSLFFFCGQNEAEKYKHELENIFSSLCTRMDELQFMNVPGFESISERFAFETLWILSLRTAAIYSNYD